jgi:hypothetical protein
MQKLTATAVTQAKPKPKPYSLSDGGGMYLLVNATAKYWRYDYRFAGKRKTLALGVYPATSLKQAREKHQRARENLANDIDPSAHKKASSAATHAALANSFELVAIEWSKTRSRKSDSTEKRQNALLEKDLLPHLGCRPIADIKAPELLKTLRKIESRGAIETAHRAKRLGWAEKTMISAMLCRMSLT